MDYVSTYFIVSLADAKRYLGMDADKIENDDLMGHVIEAVTDFIEAETRRKIIQRSITEYYDGNGTDCIPLRTFPVESSIDVRVDSARAFAADTQMASTSFALDVDAGLLYYLNGTWDAGRMGIKVTYTGGWTMANVPKLLRVAAYTAIGSVWKSRALRAWGQTSFSGVGGSSLTLSEDAMPSLVKDILAMYRSRRE